MRSTKEIQSGLSRIKELMSKHAAGTITAYLHELSLKENITRNKKLLAVLLTRGYRVLAVDGKYITDFASPNQHFVWEQQYVVVNDKVEGDDGGELEVELIDLAKVFDQKNFVSIRKGTAFQVGTSTRADAYPPFGKSVTSEVRTFDVEYGDFFSFVSGAHLMYEEVSKVEEIYYPGTLNGVRVLKMYASEVEKNIDNHKETINIIPFRRK